MPTYYRIQSIYYSDFKLCPLRYRNYLRESQVRQDWFVVSSIKLQTWFRFSQFIIYSSKHECINSLHEISPFLSKSIRSYISLTSFSLIFIPALTKLLYNSSNETPPVQLASRDKKVYLIPEQSEGERREDNMPRTYYWNLFFYSDLRTLWRQRLFMGLEGAFFQIHQCYKATSILSLLSMFGCKRSLMKLLAFSEMFHQ